MEKRIGVVMEKISIRRSANSKVVILATSLSLFLNACYRHVEDTEPTYKKQSPGKAIQGEKSEYVRPTWADEFEQNILFYKFGEQFDCQKIVDINIQLPSNNHDRKHHGIDYYEIDYLSYHFHVEDKVHIKNCDAVISKYIKQYCYEWEKEVRESFTPQPGTGINILLYEWFIKACPAETTAIRDLYSSSNK